MFQRSFVPFAATALLLSSAFAQQGPPPPYGSLRAKDVFEQFRNVLTKAKSIKVQYDAQELGLASQSIEVELVRPKMGYVKSSHREIYLNGDTITVYNVAAKTYYTMPENEYTISRAFDPVEISIWRLFFQPEAYQKSFQIRSEGFKVRKGMAMQVIAIQRDLDSLQTVTLYTDPQDSQLRQAELVRQEPRRRTTTLIDIREFKTDVDSKSEDFEFQVPDGVTFKRPARI